jgi:phage shock protein PspC (stress-responsive transcriptional regulator)
MDRKFRRLSNSDKWIGGVCAGFAYWAGIQVWVMRLVWAYLFVVFGIGLLPYIILWIFVPKWKETPKDFYERTGD